MIIKCSLQKCFSYQNKKRKTSDFQWTVDFLLQKLLCNIYLKKKSFKREKKRRGKIAKISGYSAKFFFFNQTERRRTETASKFDNICKLLVKLY